MALWTVVGCGGAPIGGPPTTGDDPPGDQPVPGDDAPPTDQPVSGDDAPTGGGGNQPPVAVIGSLQPGETRVVLNGTPGAEAFLNGSQSSDIDGTITRYEWRIDAATVAVGESVAIGGFDLGVTRVTLIVTDDDGATDFDDILVENPGLRPGRWLGVTAQGFEVAFTVTSDSQVSAFSFGYQYTGINLLNGTACVFSQPVETCTTCPAAAQSCAFDLTWTRDDGLFAASGICFQDGDPPIESAVGTVSAVPIGSNCQGGIADAPWEAAWVSP